MPKKNRFGFSDMATDDETIGVETDANGAGLSIPAGLVDKARSNGPRNRVGSETDGRSNGFADRSGTGEARRPGRKRTEPQGRLSMTGPTRVLDAFRDHADEHGGTLWEALDDLLQAARERNESRGGDV